MCSAHTAIYSYSTLDDEGSGLTVVTTNAFDDHIRSWKILFEIRIESDTRLETSSPDS